MNRWTRWSWKPTDRHRPVDHGLHMRRTRNYLKYGMATAQTQPIISYSPTSSGSYGESGPLKYVLTENPRIAHNQTMTLALQKRGPELAYDQYGEPIDIIDGQAGWLVRVATVGRPKSRKDEDGNPLIVGLYTTRAALQRQLPGVAGRVRLTAVDEWGNEIPGTPVAVIDLEPVESEPEHAHWMRLDRVFDLCDRFIGTIETKDMILSQVTKALIESHTELQNGAAELLRTATTTINVATGIERPELDVQGMCEQLAKSIEEKTPDRSRAPWFVQLADTQLGKSVAELVTGFVQGLASLQQKSK